MTRIERTPSLRIYAGPSDREQWIQPGPGRRTELASSATRCTGVPGPTMVAMVLERIGQPLVPRMLPLPLPGPGEVLLEVEACGVCRTDLHVIDGELPNIRLPMIPGHECIGRVVAVGPGAEGVAPGDRLGVPWLGGSCQQCPYCQEGKENLCDHGEFIGYTRPGGFSSHIVARAAYCVHLPGDVDPVAVAPLLCAGLIGWRALNQVGHGDRIGLYGFGASAHIVAQLARAQGREFFAFTRPGDVAAQAFAHRSGAAWVGGSDEMPPVLLDGAIVFAPDGALVPMALRVMRKGSTVVCAGIHMTDIPAFPYRLLWEERQVRSVANLTRDDARTFFDASEAAGIRTSTRKLPLAAANQAVAELRAGAIHGTAVLVPPQQEEIQAWP